MIDEVINWIHVLIVYIFELSLLYFAVSSFIEQILLMVKVLEYFLPRQ